MAKRRGKTAAELLRELEADPNSVAARNPRNARHNARVEQHAADLQSVLADLRSVGAFAVSLNDFINGGQVPRPEAIEVFVRHLDQQHLPSVHESLLRCLSISTARSGAFDWLRRRFLVELDPNLKWLIANALSAMARLDELRELPGIEEYRDLFPDG